MALASGGQRHTGMQQQPAILLGLVVLFAAAMGLRRGGLQLLHGQENRARADENRIRLLARSPVRGRILDRNGQVLVSSRLTYSLYLQPKLVNDQDWPALRARLSQLLGLPQPQLDQKRRDGPGAQRYRIELASELTPQQVLRFREQSTGLKGAEVDLDVLRSYPHGSLGAHALGYTQPITEQEYKSLAKKGYQIRDRIGRIGLEAAFESQLRGAWGGQMVEVNAMGEIQRVLGDRPSKAGKDLQTTLDLDLQRAAEEVLKDKPGGAIVALNPTNGAILALASRPTFDPNFFSKSVTTQKEYDALFNSPLKPLLSRAMSAYDPGSTWKAVTAMAGMESGKFPPNTKLATRGCITYGGHCFPDHNGAGFGTIGYEDALRFSSNTFFY
ncbi:MAG: penicillin-binding transpeptidase domain-containing protein, partial [Vulcanococcus sp.]